MKYQIASLPDDDYIKAVQADPSTYHGCEPLLLEEEQAIKQATRLSRQKNAPVGIYKLVKRVDPPAVSVSDVNE